MSKIFQFKRGQKGSTNIGEIVVSSDAKNVYVPYGTTSTLSGSQNLLTSASSSIYKPKNAKISSVYFSNSANSAETADDGTFPSVTSSGTHGQSTNTSFVSGPGSAPNVTVSIPYFTVDSNGRITNHGDRKLVLSSNNTKYTNYTNYGYYKGYYNTYYTSSYYYYYKGYYNTYYTSTYYYYYYYAYYYSALVGYYSCCNYDCYNAGCGHSCNCTP